MHPYKTIAMRYIILKLHDISNSPVIQYWIFLNDII